MVMKKIIAGILVAMVWAVAGVVDAAQVPPLINFQSVLYDDAGEAIPDGSSSVNFRITDVNGSVLYEENQTLDVVHGMVSAMVGNGLTSGGAPTGGIPLDVFEADAGRYLEVTVDGYQPQATMEIVSVPYALYADKAMGAVDGSIGGDAIKAGAITAKHFSSEALKELGGAMVSGDSLSMTTAAQSIGVRPGFSYSGSSNIQGVLTDLDRVMATRNAQMDTRVVDLQNQINAKVSKSGDTINGDLTVTGSLAVGGNASFGNSVQMNGNRVEGLGNPDSDDDATSKGYSDTRYYWRVRKYSDTLVFSNNSANRDEYCVENDGTYWCTVSVSCGAGETLLSCSGHYDNLCEGSNACDYLGSWPTGDTCNAKAGTDVSIEQRLTAYAICAY
jgi:hypothetical protein